MCKRPVLLVGFCSNSDTQYKRVETKLFGETAMLV